MADPLELDLGGKKLPIKWRRQDRAEIEKRYPGLGIIRIINTLVLPGINDNKLVAGGEIEAQTAFVWAAIRHHDKRLTEAKVTEWLDEFTAKGGNIYGPLVLCMAQLYESGVLGFVVKLQSDEDEAAGKVQPPESAGA